MPYLKTLQSSRNLGQCQAQRINRIKTFRKLKYAVKTDPGVARTGQGPTENMCPSKKQMLRNVLAATSEKEHRIIGKFSSSGHS